MNIPERFKNLCSLFNQISSNEILLDKNKYDICYDKMEAELQRLEQEYEKLVKKSSERFVLIVQTNNALEHHRKQIELLQSELEDEINR